MLLYYCASALMAFYGNAFTDELCKQYQTPFFRFERERFDMVAVGRTCDLAILHGGQGSTISMLLAGKPILEVPIVLEQYHNAMAVEKLAAGLKADQQDPECVHANCGPCSATRNSSGGRRSPESMPISIRTGKISRMLERIDELIASP